MYTLFSIRLLLLIAITVLYASFDLFNKRNVPDIFAYASVAVGLVSTLLYSTNVAVYSIILAIFIGSFGYIVYRLGFWGSGDYFELIAISLLLPIQPSPFLSSVSQLSLPFILSVFIATGLVAIWVVPIYYLFFTKEEIKSKLDAEHIAYGVSLFALYVVLAFMVFYFYGFGLERLTIMFLVAVPSAVTLVYEEKITRRMVRMVYPKELEEGDIIAMNLMSRSAIKRFSKRYSGFGRLVTKKFIKEIKKTREKLPVYKNAAPLALFVLFGTIISLLLGNLILLMV